MADLGCLSCAHFSFAAAVSPCWQTAPSVHPVGGPGCPQPGLGESSSSPLPILPNLIILIFFFGSPFGTRPRIRDPQCPLHLTVLRGPRRAREPREQSGPAPATSTELRIPPGSSARPAGRELPVVCPSFEVLWGRAPSSNALQHPQGAPRISLPTSACYSPSERGLELTCSCCRHKFGSGPPGKRRGEAGLGVRRPLDTQGMDEGVPPNLWASVAPGPCLPQRRKSA